MCDVSVDVKCGRCGSYDGLVVVDGATVECLDRFHLEVGYEEAVDRICELAQANVMLREKVRRLELMLGDLEHFVVAQCYEERHDTAQDRSQGVLAAERYIGLQNKSYARGVVSAAREAARLVFGGGR